MVLDQSSQQIRAETEEARKFLWENVVFTDGEPGLSGDLLFVAGGCWQLPEITIRQPAELIVVVENHAPLARDAKVLWKEVARKDIRRGQVLNSLAVVNHSGARCGFARLGKIKIQRAHATLNIKMMNNHIIILDDD